MRRFAWLAFALACSSHPEPPAAPAPAPAPVVPSPAPPAATFPCGTLTCAATDYCVTTRKIGGTAPPPGQHKAEGISYQCAATPPADCDPPNGRDVSCIAKIPRSHR